MYKNERLNLILDIVGQKKVISMADLEKLTFSSRSTLRRDVMLLEQEKKLVRRFGQIELVKDKNVEFSFPFRQQEHEAAKKHIALLAADFVGNNMALFLDSSSTVARLAAHFEERSNLIVITNGLFLLTQLNQMPQVKTFFAGGRLRAGSGSVLGDFAIDYLNNFHADLAILSCTSLDENGIYMSSEEQSSIKRQMIALSDQVILLCDSSKIGHTSYFKLGKLDQIDTLITDKQPSPAVIASCEAQKVELVYD